MSVKCYSKKSDSCRLFTINRSWYTRWQKMTSFLKSCIFIFWVNRPTYIYRFLLSHFNISPSSFESAYSLKKWKTQNLLPDFKTPEHDILITNELISLQTGTSGSRGKGIKRSTLVVRRSTAKDSLETWLRHHSRSPWAD